MSQFDDFETKNTVSFYHGGILWIGCLFLVVVSGSCSQSSYCINTANSVWLCAEEDPMKAHSSAVVSGTICQSQTFSRASVSGKSLSCMGSDFQKSWMCFQCSPPAFLSKRQQIWTYFYKSRPLCLLTLPEMYCWLLLKQPNNFVFRVI